MDGKLPIALKTAACCSGAVSHLTSLVASSTCLPDFGTPRKEPPQLAAVEPGAVVMSHLPLFASPAFTEIWPAIQAGQTTVAMVLLRSAAFHGSLNWARPWVSFLSAASAARFQPCWTLGLSL